MKSDLFSELLKPHFNDALNYCRALCASWQPEEAEEVLQSALLKAFLKLDHLKETDRFRSWLFKIITRTYFDHRKQFMRRKISHEVPPDQFPSVYRPENELHLTLRLALAALSPKERTTLLLYEIAGFSISEITRQLRDFSTSAVKSRLSRARKKLRVFIEKTDRPSTTSNPTVNQLTGEIEHETIQLVNEIHE